MSKPGLISMSVIKRMPRYYRFLCDLLELGTERISSRELSNRMGFTASQIRQDLNCFGGFGQQGYGYNVRQLQTEIGKILGLNNRKKAIIIGAGNIGRAIATYITYEFKTFDIIGVFDKKESMAGQMILGMPTRHISGLEEFCKENLPTVAVLCVPTSAAPEVAAQLNSLGIKGMLNFTHYDVALNYPDLQVENIHLNDSFMTLCYKLNKN
ncbi:MAG: redox-sensing transcriptional repressor Rex [Clostridia bacterium]|nr:redox-sensing transcriptional repressor Rex [Clostridia bacterium]